MSVTQVVSRPPVRRLGAALVLALGLLLTAACGTEPVQTSRPYTPAEGVNADMPASSGAAPLKVRNLLIIATSDGNGVLSASLVSQGYDTLTGVTGTAIKVDGSNGAPIQVDLTGPVPVGRQLVVLTAGPLITVSSPDLAAGLEAIVNLQFQKAGALTLRVPVMDGSQPPYVSIKPTPSASSGGPSAAPSSATPSPAAS